METPDSSHTVLEPRHTNGSWGAIISVLIILAVVVLGAYHAFRGRVSTPTPTPEQTAPAY